MDAVIQLTIFYLVTSTQHCKHYDKLFVWCLQIPTVSTVLTSAHLPKGTESISEGGAPIGVESVIPHDVVITGMLVGRQGPTA